MGQGFLMRHFSPVNDWVKGHWGLGIFLQGAKARVPWIKSCSKQK